MGLVNRALSVSFPEAYFSDKNFLTSLKGIRSITCRLIEPSSVTPQFAIQIPPDDSVSSSVTCRSTELRLWVGSVRFPETEIPYEIQPRRVGQVPVSLSADRTAPKSLKHF